MSGDGTRAAVPSRREVEAAKRAVRFALDCQRGGRRLPVSVYEAALQTAVDTLDALLAWQPASDEEIDAMCSFADDPVAWADGYRAAERNHPAALLRDDDPTEDDGSIADSIGYSPVSGGTFG